MSFDHKAYAFDFDGYRSEFESLLLEALRTDKTDGLLDFIRRHLAQIKDPYEGEPLPPGWMEIIDHGNAQECADYALTKFYEPSADMGLSHEWEEAQLELAAQGLDGSAIVLGRAFGPPGKLFDPGLMGSYLRSAADVQNDLRVVLARVNIPQPEESAISQLIEILTNAADRERGLYVTF